LPEISTIEGRLNKIVEDSNLNIQEFAERIGVDRGQFGKVLKGTMGNTLKQILEISSQFGVRTGWILEGEEPMHTKEKSGAFQLPDSLLTQLRNEIETLKINLQRISDLVPLEQEESSFQEVTFSRSPLGKTQKTGKR